jgi:FkbM family methyltransferase
MTDSDARPLPVDLRLLRCLFKLVRRGHRVARFFWSPRLKALGVVSVQTRLGFTLLVRPADVMGWVLAMHPNYEGSVGSLIAHHLNDGVFADVGANYGWFSLYAGKLLGPGGGRVFAFEPQADLAELIRQSAAINGLDNITVVEAAAADRPSRGMLLPSDWVGCSGSIGAVVTDRASDPVRVVTLDQELGDMTPSVIKIDVEGGELRVLRGMERLMACPALRCIVVEVHPPQMARLGDDPDQLLALLRNHGFRTHLISMEKQTGPLPELREFAGSLPEDHCLNLSALR